LVSNCHICNFILFTFLVDLEILGSVRELNEYGPKGELSPERMGRLRAELPRPQSFVMIQNYWAAAFRQIASHGVSLRRLAPALGVSAAHLSFIKRGKRHASNRCLRSWVKLWGLNSVDEGSLKALNALRKKSAAAKTTAFKVLRRRGVFASSYPEQVAAFDYLDRWQNIVIRELAGVLPSGAQAEDFQRQMVRPLRTVEVERALGFLVKAGFLQKTDHGGWQLPPGSPLKLDSDTERFVYANHHKQMLYLASRAIDDLPRHERHLLSFTKALTRDGYLEAVKVFQEALAKVRDLRSVNGSADQVFSFGTYAFAQSRPVLVDDS
jgi:uncharacterized protein (TIGR02147 family)